MLIDAMRDGIVRTRSGRRYKPSAIRSFESNLALHIYPALGAHALQDVRRGDVQRVADRLVASGRSPSTVRNALMPLRVIYRRALSLEDVSVNPTTRLDLPAVEGGRDRVATPTEASALIEALPPAQRALWATVFYAGLRRGELMALQELMGHASITETFDCYGHLFPGTKDEAAAMLDAYLEQATSS